MRTFRLSRFAKTVVAVIGVIATTVGTYITDDAITTDEAWLIVTSLVTAFGVWGTRNRVE